MARRRGDRYDENTREIETQLSRIPTDRRNDTRTRVNAVRDYIAAGEKGALIVDLLCHRIGVTRSTFYALVRKWRSTGGSVLAMMPWHRSPDKPRINPASTAHIMRIVTPLVDADPAGPIEPIAQHVLEMWPSHLPKPGISYVRKTATELRSRLAMKPRRKKATHDEIGAAIEHLGKRARDSIKNTPHQPLHLLAQTIFASWPADVHRPSYRFVRKRIGEIAEDT